MPPAYAGDHAKSKWGYLTGDVRRKYIAPHIAIFEFRASRSAIAERRREIVSLLPQPALAICHQKREYPERMTLAPKSGGKPN
ncbi:MAG: hypothetical protein M0Q93_11005 [Terrimicrobiaceae bacterium]|nr:hypothetical protein [Terrimicrobiaceae bacterium]